MGGKKSSYEASKNHGCFPINSFFPAVEKKTSAEVLDENKENQMGAGSHQCGSGVKKWKRMGQEKAQKQKKKLPSPAKSPAHKKQKTIEGNEATKRQDEGDDICIACQKIKQNPNWKSFAHHPTCKHNKYYHQTDGGRISLMEWHLQEAEKLHQEELN